MFVTQSLTPGASNAEFRDYFFSLVAQKNLTFPSQEAFVAMDADLVGVGIIIAKDSSGFIRGRIYLPTGGADKYRPIGRRHHRLRPDAQMGLERARQDRVRRDLPIAGRPPRIDSHPLVRCHRSLEVAAEGAARLANRGGADRRRGVDHERARGERARQSFS